MHVCRALVVLALLTNVAIAQEVQVQLRTQVRPGEHPTLTVTSAAPIASVRVEVDRDGKPLVVTHGAVAAGRTATLALPAGKAHYRGQVVTRFVGGTSATSELTFDVGTSPSGDLKIGYAREHLDLDAHTLEFTLTKAAASADLKVIGDDGNELGQAHADFHGDRAGAWLPIAWTPTRAGNVLALELHATSSDGSQAGVRLVPWSVHIPHEEVVFESGKAEIRPSEEAKLDASYKQIVDAVAEVRKAAPDLPVRLFIAGHTDTVGGAADNRKLSLARARAIAAWYHDRGLPLPIAYAGFGEDALKRKTADNVDEAANRRADYIVGVEEPQVAKGVRAPWYKLQ